MALRRVRRELASVATWKPREKQAVLLVPDPSNILQLKGIVIAPAGCPMEGYIYFLDICLPPDYPFRHPRVRFETRVWLSKVDPGFGGIKSLGVFTPNTSFETILGTIPVLFTMSGVPWEVVMNSEADRQYEEDPAIYNKQAKEWAEKHNQGYCMEAFEDYFVSAIQSILKIPGVIKYEARVYCRKESSHLWKAVVVVFPKVEEFLAAVESPYSLSYQKLTEFEFDFASDEITIGEGDEEAVISAGRSQLQTQPFESKMWMHLSLVKPNLLPAN